MKPVKTMVLKKVFLRVLEGRPVKGLQRAL
jgi:hypothetical protein